MTYQMNLSFLLCYLTVLGKVLSRESEFLTLSCSVLSYNIDGILEYIIQFFFLFVVLAYIIGRMLDMFDL